MAYGTRWLNSAFIRALHWALSWAESIIFLLLTPICLISILTPSHLRLGLLNGLFAVSLHVKILKSLLPSSILATCLVHLNLLDLLDRRKIILSENVLWGSHPTSFAVDFTSTCPSREMNVGITIPQTMLVFFTGIFAINQ